MMRKLTTIIDSKLARENSKDHGYHSFDGFRECMELIPRIVYMGLKHAQGMFSQLAKEIAESRRLDGESSEKKLADFMQEKAHRFRYCMEDANRVEAVIRLRDKFELFIQTYRKSEKHPFCTLYIEVKLNGGISQIRMMED